MKRVYIAGFFLASVLPSYAQSWSIDTRGASGPIVQLTLPSVAGKSRTSFVALEYARRCDPLFSFIEVAGTKLGSPVSQAVLSGSKIGLILNGNFYTWHAAKTTYSNGYEAALGITNELALQLLVNVQSLYFVTPDGERIQLQSAGLSKALQTGIEYCRSRIK